MTAVIREQASTTLCPNCEWHEIDPACEDVCRQCADQLIRREAAMTEWLRWKGFASPSQAR